MNKAVKIITSDGLADATDPLIAEQVRRKRPLRRTPISAPPVDFYGGGRALLRCSLEGRLRTLDTMAGIGAVEGYNEHYSCLDREFDEPLAREAVKMLEWYGGQYLNGKLPAWCYYLVTAARVVTPIKDDHGGEGTPDVRPIGVGGRLRCAILKFAVADAKGPLKERFWPTQVAVGTPGGSDLLVNAVRETMARAPPDWVVIKIDARNMFNELSRQAILDEVEGNKLTQRFSAVTRAEFLPKSPIFLAGCGKMQSADFNSEEGG